MTKHKSTRQSPVDAASTGHHHHSSSSSLNSNSSHSFVLVSNSDSLNHNQNHNYDYIRDQSQPQSPRRVQSPNFAPSIFGGQTTKAVATKENQDPISSTSPTLSDQNNSSPTKSSNQVKGNTKSYKQIMRPVSPDHASQPRSRNGNGNGTRSRSRSRKVSSVVIESKEWEKVYKKQTNQEVEQEFESMLTELEIPPALRVKLTALDSTVKSSMLRGQATLNLSSLTDAYGTTTGSRARSRSPSKSNGNPNSRGAIPFKAIRKSKSSSSLAADEVDNMRRSKLDKGIDQDDEDDDQLFVAPKRKSLFGSSSGRSASGGNGNGNHPSIPSSSSNSHLPSHRSPEKNKSSSSSLQTANINSPPPKNTAKSRIRAASFGRDILTGSSFRESPITFATLLQTSSSPDLPLSSLKRLRVLLSTESPIWLGEFISNGGYQGLLSRLDEIFGMEWREDVRDDEVLHELLRGLNALATTPKGKMALASDFPRPFTKMIDLLFSEKRPGDISTRKLMVELMISMSDLIVEKTLKSSSGFSNEEENGKVKESNSDVKDDPYSSIFNSRVPSSSFSLARISCDSRTSTSFLILLVLLHNPRTPTQDAMLSFVKEAHAQRPFKTYLTEVAGTCRDYFWIFCHSQNRFWRLEDVDVQEVEGPKVPGGMTGGVEFEAMGYLTTHMKLINTVASHLQAACQGKKGGESMAAYEFHQMMFASGWERILATIRRSSQVYYAPLHLELARYFYLTSLCRFQVPANLSVWFATPRSTRSGGGGVAPTLSEQMSAANKKNLGNERNTPRAIHSPSNMTGSPQIQHLPRIEPLNLGLDQDQIQSSTPPTNKQPEQAHAPIEAGKVKRELPVIPNQQSSPSKGTSELPIAAEKSICPIKSSKSSDPDSLPLESSAFSPSSKEVQQPFSSGKWMAHGKGVKGSSSSPSKSPVPRRDTSPQRQTHDRKVSTSATPVDPRVVSTDLTQSSSEKANPLTSDSSTKQVAPSPKPEMNLSPQLGNGQTNLTTSPRVIGSPLPNPFDRFYPDASQPPNQNKNQSATSQQAQPQPNSQPLSPLFLSQNVMMSPRQNHPQQHQACQFTRENEMGPKLPKRGAQDSVVGTAVKRWEQRARENVVSSPNPSANGIPNVQKVRNNSTPAGTGLGLGWANNGRN